MKIQSLGYWHSLPQIFFVNLEEYILYSLIPYL